MNMIARPLDEAWPARRRLHVTMLGLRGFPNVQGGVENHVENLSSELVELGCDADVIVRSAYVPNASPRIWRNIRLVRLWSPRVKGLEALLHTLLGVLWAAWTRPDILHIHAIGPALFTPLARTFGLRVVVTHHVLNYENEKWGPAARWILRLGERAGMTFANGRIAVSAALAARMEHCYRVPVRVIPNGIIPPRRVQSNTTLEAFGLQPNRYLLIVARLDEQKRQLDLIEAFSRAKRGAWKLAIAGGADYASEYARAVARAACQTEGVVLLGHRIGDALAELYSNAGVFVLPSSHEGQPIAVLEAMSYGCPAILSDIPAHRELCNSRVQFFPVGDIAALTDRLDAFFREAPPLQFPTGELDQLMSRHDWREIARNTLEVYFAALPRSPHEVRGDFSNEPFGP
jgi:glycosyltransferase involved in cell wall biosynthesis